MSNVKIVTDSSCMMDPKLAEELDIHIISLSVMIDGVIYANHEELGKEEFMEMMAGAKALPKTSQPPIGEFVDLYDRLGKDGSHIISIHLTEHLSGTSGAAHQAAQLTESAVTVIDSDFIDQALSFQVIRAAQMAQMGATVEQILPEIDKVKENTTLYIGVSTLDNLVKGGRVNRIVGTLSGLLNMRVVLELNKGRLEIITKGRGNKTFTKWVNQFCEQLKTMPKVKALGISHAGGMDIARELKERIQRELPSLAIPIMHTSPLVATHTGKGAFAVMLYTED
ncbi:DegV family protein [Vagococcus acidifermentans]|uniref:EDD domain protein n=1 Tax=Vagococcus acidifermentans TaxID=564710 RepID=A0A430AY02_9ENTE|nr:DegV family protein [Vagococcus acidifermentans]RSU12937.1 EDD domain protein [Vagococcus acidifermentans]